MKNRELNPWYVILWRALWWPFYMVGLILSFLALSVTIGLDSAISFWKHNV
jgi:hypothetical protein